MSPITRAGQAWLLHRVRPVRPAGRLTTNPLLDPIMRQSNPDTIVTIVCLAALAAIIVMGIFGWLPGQ